MAKRLGKFTINLTNKPKIISAYSVVGKKEGEGAFKNYFDHILKDDRFGEKSYEGSEKRLLEFAITNAIDRSKKSFDEIDLLIAGDLMNQITSSSFSARALNLPFLGLYSACSTMTEGLAVGACLTDSNCINTCAVATASHFSTVEKQFRFPLELGNQRPPVAQWTVTGAGCSVLSNTQTTNYLARVERVTFGKVVDFGVKDVNNMGAAMAPSAQFSIVSHFEDTKTTPDDYDLILTGDLGKLGSEILRDLMEHAGYKLGANYADCGQMIYSNDQRTFMGGSGAGCSASVFNSYMIKKLAKQELKKVLFVATGALLSPTSSQQGNSVPGIAHAVYLTAGSNESLKTGEN